MKYIVLVLLALVAFSANSAFAKSGDYPNWGPEPVRPQPARGGAGIACGPWDINDYGTHEDGKTSVTIFTNIKARPDLKYLYVQYDSVFAHQFWQETEGRCACMDYTWNSVGDTMIPTLVHWDFQPASEMRACPPERSRARSNRRRR